MLEPATTPQNPYDSFIVEASAGSGKTYQLSHRFLMLVGAGADPASILTVTFTKKAAAEMRGRILKEATALLSQASAQQLFSDQLQRFYQALNANQRRSLPPPRSPADVGDMILNAAQRLRISTIDSLYYEWMSEFPVEASPPPDDEAPAPSAHPYLLNAIELKELDERAWRATCQFVSQRLRAHDQTYQRLLRDLPGQSIQTAKQRLDFLSSFETYVWFAEQSQDTALRQYALTDIASPTKDEAPWSAAEAALMASLIPALTAVAKQISHEPTRNSVLAAIAAGDFNALLRSPLITKTTFCVSASVIKGQKRIQLASSIADIDAGIQKLRHQRLLATLNAEGAALFHLYKLYSAAKERLKQQVAGIEFNDLTKACFRLFHHDAGVGARFILARRIQHVMMDEFQDTSRLQWAIFAEMLREILAGDGIGAALTPLPPTAFIVGDPKQSIFGFREADPSVMNDASQLFAEQLRPAPLHHSFRTAQIVLDFVNVVFKTGPLAPYFPPHQTAMLKTANGDSLPVIANVGSVVVLPLATAEQSPPKTPLTPMDPPAVKVTAVEREAAQLADFLAAALAQPERYPIAYKDAHGQVGYRPLRPQDCAVLYRSSVHAEVYSDALRARGLACVREEERGFFSRCEISDALALLKFLALPADVVALCTVLRSPLGGLTESELLNLLLATRPPQDRTISDKARTAAMLAQLEQAAGGHDSHRQVQLATTLKALLQATESLRPHALLRQAFAGLQAYQAYDHRDVQEAIEGQLSRRNLFRLLELVLDLERDGFNSPLAVHERLLLLGQDNDYGSASGGSQAVTLMTVHKAKGLEFPLVAVVDTGRPWGKSDAYWVKAPRAEAAGIYYVGTSKQMPLTEPQFAQLQSQALTETGRECERLLYVALTRARQYLVLSGHAGRGSDLSQTTYYERLVSALKYTLEATNQQQPTSSASEVASPILVCSNIQATEVDAIQSRIAPEPQAATVIVPPAVADLSLPHEIKLLAPSTAASQRSNLSSFCQSKPPPFAPSLPKAQPYARELSLAIGFYIHAGLEAFVRQHWPLMKSGVDQPFIEDDLVNSTWWTEALKKSGFSPLAPAAASTAWVAAARSAHTELRHVLKSAVWQNILAEAVTAEPELELVHRSGSRLVRGCLDLLIKRPDGSMTVIDYKTGEINLGEQAFEQQAAWRDYCIYKGYDQQLQTYLEALTLIYPRTLIRSQVFFTKSLILVDVGM